MANMEELHMAALAYYRNAPNELRQLAINFFNSMDTNGDGVVSFNEFVEFIVQNVNNRADPNFFRSLDRNGDGWLDFYEVLTFYYILKTRVVYCDCCGICLMGLYFTCVACFDNARSTGHTYDLCSACYEARRHQQHHPHHNDFLDSYLLLRAKAGLPFLAGAPNLQQALIQHAPNISQRALVQHAPNISQRALVPRGAPKTPHQRIRTALQALDTAFTVGGWALWAGQLGCSIM